MVRARNTHRLHLGTSSFIHSRVHGGVLTLNLRDGRTRWQPPRPSSTQRTIVRWRCTEALPLAITARAAPRSLSEHAARLNTEHRVPRQVVRSSGSRLGQDGKASVPTQRTNSGGACRRNFFTFDKAFQAEASQAEVYGEVSTIPQLTHPTPPHLHNSTLPHTHHTHHTHHITHHTSHITHHTHTFCTASDRLPLSPALPGPPGRGVCAVSARWPTGVRLCVRHYRIRQNPHDGDGPGAHSCPASCFHPQIRSQKCRLKCVPIHPQANATCAGQMLPEGAGVIPRAVEQIFAALEGDTAATIRVSCLVRATTPADETCAHH